MGKLEVDMWLSPLEVFFKKTNILSSAWRMDQGCLVEGERKFWESWPGDITKMAMVTTYKTVAGEGCDMYYTRGLPVLVMLCGFLFSCLHFSIFQTAGVTLESRGASVRDF